MDDELPWGDPAELFNPFLEFEGKEASMKVVREAVEDSIDADEMLFAKQTESRAVAVIQESINELIEKGKRRTLRYDELLARRKARERRLMQLDEAKTFLLLYIARAFAVNAEITNPFNKAMMLSLLPTDHIFSDIFSNKSKSAIAKQFQRIVSRFSKRFGQYLELEGEQGLPNLARTLQEIGQKAQPKMGRLEYLLAFAIYLSLQPVVFRVNFIIDISTMEQSKAVKVTRGAARPKPDVKVEDKYEYGMQQRNQKRKYKDFFSERKMFYEEEEEVKVEQEFKKFRLNTILPEIGEQAEEVILEKEEAVSFFEKFAFDPKGKRTVKRATLPIINPRPRAKIEATDTQMTDSHLFLGNTGGKTQVSTKAATIKGKQSEDSVESQSDLELTFSEGLFIEVYDELSNQWLICCPLTNQVYTSLIGPMQYFKDQQTLFILAAQPYRDYSTLETSNIYRDLFFLRDVGALYVSDRDLVPYLKAKGSCILTRYVEDFINQFAAYISYYADVPTAQIIRLEDQILTRREMRLIPSTFNEFKNSKYYALPSCIRKYQGLLPNAEPIGTEFKGEQIYLKQDITELHTQERWRKHARQVTKGECPVKRVKGLYNDPERMADLFGYWQTVPFRIALTAEGKIPANQYGNIEIFNGPLPENTVHVDMPKAAMVCRKLGLDHVPAVIGFEKGPTGRSHPCVSGVVTFKQNVALIEKEWELMNSQSEMKMKEKIEKRAKQVWRQLIKAILVKKFISEKYDRECQ